MTIWDHDSEHWLAPDDIYNRDRDERDMSEPDDEGYARSLYDPNLGWIDV